MHGYRIGILGNGIYAKNTALAKQKWNMRKNAVGVDGKCLRIFIMLLFGDRPGHINVFITSSYIKYRCTLYNDTLSDLFQVFFDKRHKIYTIRYTNKYTPGWRNWQTRTTQNRVEKSVEVRFLSRAHTTENDPLNGSFSYIIYEAYVAKQKPACLYCWLVIGDGSTVFTIPIAIYQAYQKTALYPCTLPAPLDFYLVLCNNNN